MTRCILHLELPDPISGLRSKPAKPWDGLSDDWCNALKITGKGAKGVVPRAIEHFERHLMPPPLNPAALRRLLGGDLIPHR